MISDLSYYYRKDLTINHIFPSRIILYIHREKVNGYFFIFVNRLEG
jgi:hypothetical protein